MKNFRLLILVTACVSSIFSCVSAPKRAKTDYPMFWTWHGYGAKHNFDSVCNVFAESGIDGIVLNAKSADDYREAIPIANKHGIKVYAWMWSMNPEHGRAELVKEHPEWFSVNREGDRIVDVKAYVDYYKFMCPKLPEVREYLKNKTKELCEVEGLEGIAIDYHRLVDVILPTTLWSKYDVIQDREYGEWDYGYHPEMIKAFKAEFGYDPSELEDPSTDEKWLQFRCDQVTEAANDIAEVVHSYSKVMAASPFPTPKMSRKMVRQDWGKWNLDIVFPMVYHKYYTGDVSFISDCTMDNVKQKNPMTTLYCGMTVSAGQEMIDCMEAALNNGAQGIAIFTANSLKTPEARAQFKAYADSMRNVRATTGLSYDPSKKPNINPFENKGIMDMIDMRMKSYVSLANSAAKLKLSDKDFAELQKACAKALEAQSEKDYINRLAGLEDRYKGDLKNSIFAEVSKDFSENIGKISLELSKYDLADEFGTTKYYKVTDKTTGITFKVDFYFYGGIISGWNIFTDTASYEAYFKKI